jgi:uncharacterized protein YigE (DUF2233 family)
MGLRLGRWLFARGGVFYLPFMKTSAWIGCLLSLAGFFGGRSPARGADDLFQSFDPRSQTLEVFRAGPEGLSLRDVQRQVEARGKRLLFACNSGIFEPGFIPTGLHRDAAGEWTPLNLKSGAGNFYTKPNGVFYLQGQRAFILESCDFAVQKPRATLAIQSGPLLLSAGKPALAFSPDNPSRKTRHGVGIKKDGTALFAWARHPVNLHDFAQWFQQQGCRSALYLDGQISRMHQDPGQHAAGDEKFAAVLTILE